LELEWKEEGCDVRASSDYSPLQLADSSVIMVPAGCLLHSPTRMANLRLRVPLR